jgi:hypothetical protein
MCEYCCEEDNFRIPISKQVFGSTEVAIGLNIEQSLIYTNLSNPFENQYANFVTQNINFCPMCGRKLGDE